MKKIARVLLVALPSLVLATACANDTPHPEGRPDTGPVTDSGPKLDARADAPSGLTLRPFTPPADPGANGILFTSSGEVLALGGYDFPPAMPGDPAFIDGWEVHFTRLLVTLDKLALFSDPDSTPSDQSKTGALVAEVDGPWAIDLHQGGPLPGKGGAGEKAVAIAALTAQNRNGDAAFDGTKRYAFGFDVIAATRSAMSVNLDADGLADYAEMIAKGYAVFYVGTATFKGGASCTTGEPSYDFSQLPKVVSFRLGFKSPTTYVNCQNPDNMGTPFMGEEAPRGIQTDPTKTTIGQVTIHTDHPFWESTQHDAPAHFDQIAARYLGADRATAVSEDLVGVSFTGFKDKNGKSLPWRSCLASSPAKPGQLAFDPRSTPVSPSGPPDKALRDALDYMTYNQSTQGHLNSNGLCFVRRNYPSPP